MSGFLIFVSFISFIAFIVYWRKKANARKAAGEKAIADAKAAEEKAAAEIKNMSNSPADTSAAMKKPWNYYGKVVTISGQVSFVRARFIILALGRTGSGFSVWSDCLSDSEGRHAVGIS